LWGRNSGSLPNKIYGDLISRWDLRGGIGSGRLNYIEKYEAVCDLCGGLIALMKRELEEKAREYAVIVDGRIIRAICEACKRRFWGWA